MSDTDSFIEEVNEEVRRDRLYLMMRRYGWIAVLAVVLIVGGAAFNEYNKAQAKAQAEALGDAMLASLTHEDAAARAEALAQTLAENPQAENPQAAAVLALLTAAAQSEADETEAAIATLTALALGPDTPDSYRQLAQFKTLVLQSGVTPADERRQGFEAMAQPGSPMRMLAQEQLALIDIETGAPDAAIAKYQAIIEDAESTPDLQQRARQVIVALGGEPVLVDQQRLNSTGATSSSN